MSDWQQRLRALAAGPWHGFPAPNEAAITRAEAVIAWGESRGILVSEVDADDVLGGVAVYLVSTHQPNRPVWVALMNSGTITVTLNDARGRIESLEWGARAKAMILAHLGVTDEF